MSIFQQTLEQSDERFLRDVGISKATFQQLLDKVATYLAVQREKNPMKKRGLKSTTSLADQLLLTLDLPQTLSYLCQVGQGVFNQ